MRSHLVHRPSLIEPEVRSMAQRRRRNEGHFPARLHTMMRPEYDPDPRRRLPTPPTWCSQACACLCACRQASNRPDGGNRGAPRCGDCERGRSSRLARIQALPSDLPISCRLRFLSCFPFFCRISEFHSLSKKRTKEDRSGQKRTKEGQKRSKADKFFISGLHRCLMSHFGVPAFRKRTKAE